MGLQFTVVYVVSVNALFATLENPLMEIKGSMKELWTEKSHRVGLTTDFFKLCDKVLELFHSKFPEVRIDYIEINHSADLRR